MEMRFQALLNRLGGGEGQAKQATGPSCREEAHKGVRGIWIMCHLVS